MHGAVLLYLLSGCAAGPDFHRPQVPAVNGYTHGTDPGTTVAVDGTAQRFSSGTAATADWWRLFGSATLATVVDEAMTHNPGLDAAQASLRQSQDVLRSGYGIFYPAIDASAAATRERFNSLAFGQAVSGKVFNLFTLSATVSYALDVFGGQRRMVEGLRAQLDVANATALATYLTLSSNIVNTIIARAAYQAESDATEQLVELQQQQVQLAEVQARAGTVPYSTVLSLRSQLASYQTQLPQLAQKIAQSNDLLASLAGHAPAEWTAPAVQLADISLPAALPLSVPSDLLRQRPDILAAEATAHAASAQIGVATAAMLPSVTLTGDLAGSTNSIHTLFPANGRSWSIGANVTAPVFEGGTLWFKRRAAIEGYRQESDLYRQTVLSAFAQVADTLHALDNDAKVLAAEEEALSAAREALHLVQANYDAGLSTYLDVLNADAQYHQAQIAQLEAVATRYQDTVALFAALGGGWWNRPDSPRAAAQSN
ncbi:MAG TPA: efflux transporter outer membrane subunit [Steroidobacteraceae bacterium]|nr:efflux transporter outer membrane subunit [Steroidobacteraceae bacterium]